MSRGAVGVCQPPVSAISPLLRSMAFAVVAVPVSLVGHLAGGGCAPDEASVLLGFVTLVTAFRLLMSGRERSWAALSACLVAGQLMLHVLFAGSAPSAHHVMVSMLGAHVVAAVALGWFLRQGEQALWSAAGRARHRLSPLHRRIRSAVETLANRLVRVEPPWDVPARGATGEPVTGPLVRHRRHATACRRRRGPPNWASPVPSF